jgi:LDH2 family malate/lactate/ureidoglycolate dehydrogenase
MTMTNDASITVTGPALTDVIAAGLECVGLPADDALRVARLMAQADQQGSDGHGIIRLPQYIKRIQAGGMNVSPNIHVVSERAGMAVVDGDNGMGTWLCRSSGLWMSR